MRKEKLIKKGKWRTIEWFFNATGEAHLKPPKDAWIKVRYGFGWFGKDRQKQKLDGFNIKKLKVGSWSLTRARMQIKVKKDTRVTYHVNGSGIVKSLPPFRF